MHSSPLRDLHAKGGARVFSPRALDPNAPPGAATPVLTYGDVPGEYAAARTGALLLDVSERGLVRLTGADTEGFLHRILANHVKGLAPDTGNRNLLLSGKGKVVHDFDLARTGPTTFEASTPPGEAQRLVASLDLYLFTEDTALEDATEEHAPLELVGPAARDVVARALASGGDGPFALPEAAIGTQLATPPPAPHPAQTFATAAHGAVRVTALEVAGEPGLRLEPSPAAAPGLWQALVAAGARPGGLVAWDSLRAERVVAASGRDVSAEVYPQEARLEDAFALDKGCYIGQEVVAKIDTYGGLNKRLMLLRVDHDEPVSPGTRLVARDAGEARDLGLVTTWAYSFALDGGVVLGYVKRKHQDEGRAFELVAPGASEASGRATIVAAPAQPR
ncbi:MAG: glycine cleavage T C-terminal barrel domain-containing protein [Planctomycetota bacterium]